MFLLKNNKIYLFLIFLTPTILFYFNPNLLLGFFHDDTYFYAVIANNFNWYQFSFDGISKTNGFHPLWQLLLVAISNILPFEDYGGLFYIFLLSIILNLSSLVIFNYTLHNIDRQYFKTKYLYIFNLSFVSLLLFNDIGLEVSLSCLIISLLFYIYFSSIKLKDIFFNLLIIILIISRQDLIFIALAFSLFFFLKKEFLKCFFIFLSIFIGLFILMAFNFYFFNEFRSISSVLKGFFSFDNFNQIYRYGILIRVLIIYFLLFFSLYIYSYFKKNTILKYLIISFILSFTTYLLILLFYVQHFGSWYFYNWIAVSLFIFIKTILLANEQKILKMSYLICVFLILIGSIIFTKKILHNNTESSLEISEWINNNLSMEARIFQVDGVGRVSYFTNSTIINGDGLVNSFDYQKYLKENDICNYLLLNDINYILTAAPTNNNLTEDKILLWKNPQKLLYFRDYDKNALYLTTSKPVYKIFKIKQNNLICPSLVVNEFYFK